MSYLIPLPLPLDVRGVRAFLVSRQERVLLQLRDRDGRVHDDQEDAEAKIRMFPGVRQVSFCENNSILVDIEIDNPESLTTLRHVAFELVVLADDYEADQRLGRPNP